MGKIKSIINLLSALLCYLPVVAQSQVVPVGEEDFSEIVPEIAYYHYHMSDRLSDLWLIGDFNDWQIPEGEDSNGAIRMRIYDNAVFETSAVKIPCNPGVPQSFMIYNAKESSDHGKFSTYYMGPAYMVHHNQWVGPFVIKMGKSEYKNQEFFEFRGIMRYYSDYDEAVNEAKKFRFSVESDACYYVSQEEVVQAFSPITVHSDKTYVVDNTTGVESIDEEGMLESEYFDLTGRMVSKPSGGIYICKRNGKFEKVHIP